MFHEMDHQFILSRLLLVQMCACISLEKAYACNDAVLFNCPGLDILASV